MKRFLLLLAAVLIIYSVGPAPLQAAEKEYQWINVQNLKDSSGNALGDQYVYGYFLDVGSKQVFVQCDPSTKKPSGKCYYNTQEIKTITEQVVVDYQKKEYEDWNSTKVVLPVSVSLMAPNIMSSTSWDWDYYEQTGQMRPLAKGPVEWPGGTGACLIPGSDPDYWLIVAKCTNPNPFPVKATINADISNWRDSFSNYDSHEDVTKTVDNVYLGANDTKFVLINRGKKYSILGEDVDWRSETSMDAWSNAIYSASVTENLDPELPDNLKPNKGYISFTNYVGNPPVPNNLSGGYTVVHYVQCYPYGVSSTSYNYWYFDGTVTLTEEGWKVTPGSNSKNPTVAKQKMEQFFSGLTPDQVPYVDSDDSQIINGIRFNKCEDNGVKAETGPQQNYYDDPGPVLIDYTNAEDYNLSAKVLSSDEPDYVGWIDNLPVLKYEPTFLEIYRFQPTVSAEVGKLVKEVVPGYIVHASSIKRPYFEINDTYTGFNTTFVNVSGDNDYYKVQIQHQVTITAKNDSDVRVQFPSCNLVASNIRMGKEKIQDYIENKMGYAISVWPDNKNQTDGLINTFSLGDVTVEPGEDKVVYSGTVTSEFNVYWLVSRGSGYSPLYINETLIEDAIKNVAPSYFNWIGEMTFRNPSSQVIFTPVDGSDLLSLNNALCKYRDDGEDEYQTIGFVDRDNGPKFLQALSYFNNGDGLAMKATDEVWAQLQAAKILSTTVNPYLGTGIKGIFWSFMTYSSKHGWSSTLSDNNLFD